MATPKRAHNLVNSPAIQSPPCFLRPSFFFFFISLLNFNCIKETAILSFSSALEISLPGKVLSFLAQMNSYKNPPHVWIFPTLTGKEGKLQSAQNCFVCIYGSLAEREKPWKQTNMEIAHRLVQRKAKKLVPCPLRAIKAMRMWAGGTKKGNGAGERSRLPWFGVTLCFQDLLWK